ncbi:hypothetical protein U1Q18_015936 [Sarracenia purpurea var. burkii]
MELQMSPQLEQIHGEIRDNFRALAYVSALPLSPCWFDDIRVWYGSRFCCSALRAAASLDCICFVSSAADGGLSG